MTEHACSPRGGYNEIAAALARTAPGDTVRLAPGRYEGAETLRLGSGVTLSGAGAVLVHRGPGPALEARGVASVAVEGISVEVRAEDVPFRRVPEAAPYEEGEDTFIEWGVVWFDAVADGRIEAVGIDGARACHGICLRGGKGTSVTGCAVMGSDGSGLSLIACQAGKITGNRCHGNANSGITFYSSHAPEIAGNECWGNQASGIALRRGSESPHTPSEAAVRHNRCYGNAYTGIGLQSSHAPEIAGNECWGNQGSGIVLLRGPESPRAPSEAAVRHNRCHGNAYAGIAFSSSHAPEIAGNECWDNETSGIEVSRDTKSPDAPSVAALRGNRCHGNAESGIAFSSSYAPEIAGNECWRNRMAGFQLTIWRGRGASVVDSAPGNDLFDNGLAVIATHGTVLPPDLDRNRAWGKGKPSSWVTQPNETTTLVQLSTPLPITFLPGPADSGPTAAALAMTGLSDPDQLARFVDGPGCLHCLDAWWPAERSLEATAATDHVDGRYLCRAETERLHFRREASGDGTAAIWAELHRLAGGLGRDGTERRAETGRLALVTADASVIDGLPDQIAALRRSQATKADPPTGLPESVRRAIRDLRFAPASVAEPVVIDHLPRSQAAMTGADDLSPMFDEALLRDRRRGLAALRVLAATPMVWLVFLGLPLAVLTSAYGLGAPGAPPDEPALWMEPWAAILRALASQVGALELFDVVGLPGTALALLVTDLCFFLALLPPALRPRLPGAVRKRLDTSAGTDGAAWRRWARQRIFEREIGVVVIRDAQEWGPRDMADLRALMDLRPADRSLLMVLHTPGRSQMGRAVLRPLAERPESKDPDLLALDGLRLAVGRPPAPLDLADPTEAVPLGPLIGVMAQDTARLASRKRNIRDGSWSPSDIVPMLVIGSTPDLPMTLGRPVSDLAEKFVPPLEAALLPWVRMFEGDPAATLRLGSERDLLRAITEEEAAASRAVHLVVRRGAGADTLDLVGQPARRAMLLSALREIFDTDSDRRAYALRLLACGMLHAIDEAVAAARRGRTDGDLATLLRALRAAGQLDAEIESMGGLDEARRAMLEAASAPLAEALAALRVPRMREAQRLACLVACRADRMKLLRAAPVLNGGADPDTPGGLLADRVATAAALWGKLDRGLAPATVARYLHFELQEADTDLRAAIEARLADGARAATTLSDLIWSAPDLDGLLALLEAHAPLGGQRAAILALQLAGAAEPEVRLAAARAVAALRRADVPLVHAPRGSQRRAPHCDADILRLARLVEDPGLVALLKGDGDTAQDADPFLDVELGYFDPAHVEVKRRVEIVLED